MHVTASAAPFLGRYEMLVLAVRDESQEREKTMSAAIRDVAVIDLEAVKQWQFVRKENCRL